jgi:hypothetical protein
MRLYLIIALLPVVSTGCTSVALERATLAHAASSTDLRYKEAIENLAMIASNPALLPAYSSIHAGTTNVTDIVRGSTVSTWARTAMKPFRYATYFATQNADFTGSRAVKSNWTLDPVIVPEKLRAIRAACRWVAFGPENVGPEIRFLQRYEPPRFLEKSIDGTFLGMQAIAPGCEEGYYFDVADRLRALPRGWLHHVDRRLDVPRDACYWAGCGGKFVWVGPEGMAALSEFVLILQQIARADLGSAYFPRPVTRTIRIPFQSGGLLGGGTATATLYVDEEGRLTPGQNARAIPIKARQDNVGTSSELRSVINASAKGP